MILEVNAPGKSHSQRDWPHLATALEQIFPISGLSTQICIGTGKSSSTCIIGVCRQMEMAAIVFRIPRQLEEEMKL